MTPETLVLLRDLLAAQQLSVGASDFIEAAQQIATALAELDVAIASAGPGDVVPSDDLDGLVT